MTRVSASAPVLCLFALFSVLLLSCGSGGDDGGPTPAAESPTPADATAIRDVDLTQAAPVLNFMRQLGGGELDRQAVLYADLTKDGREEAIVPIHSGGTLGNLGYVVLTLRSGSPAAILTATRDRNSIGGVAMYLEDGKLRKTIGKYGAEDPRCCPSALIRTTYYWDGSNLQVEGEEEVKQTGPKQ